MAVVIPFSPADSTIDRLVDLVSGDMQRVNTEILARTGSEVTMIPEVANHLISSGGKRLRPMLTLAMASLTGYEGDGHIKLAAAVEFMHTATLLHDDVVDESDLRRGRPAARKLWGNEASVLVGDFLLQADWMVRDKAKPQVLAMHVAVVVAATWVALGFAPAPGLLLLIFVIHFAIELQVLDGEFLDACASWRDVSLREPPARHRFLE